MSMEANRLANLARMWEKDREDLERQLQKAAENNSLMFGCPVDVYEAYICEKEDCPQNIIAIAACWRELWRKKKEVQP